MLAVPVGHCDHILGPAAPRKLMKSTLGDSEPPQASGKTLVQQELRLPKAAELDATGFMPYLCAECDRFCAR
jgi:hypothetical protein